MKYLLSLSLVAILLPSVAFADFDTNLKYGSIGVKVTELQEFLTEQGVYNGPITGNFFSLTRAGVKAYQAKNNIEPVSGYWGPISRGVAQAVLDAEDAQSNADEVKQTGTNTPAVPVVVQPVVQAPVVQTPVVTPTPVVTTPPVSGNNNVGSAPAPAKKSLAVYVSSYAGGETNYIQINTNKAIDLSTVIISSAIPDTDRANLRGENLGYTLTLKESRVFSDQDGGCFVHNSFGDLIDKACGGYMYRLTPDKGFQNKPVLYAISFNSTDGDYFQGPLEVYNNN